MQVYTVKSARKEYICDKCQKPISVGESYIWWRPVKDRKYRWHISHGMPPKAILASGKNKKKAYEARDRMLIALEILRKRLEEAINKQLHNAFGECVDSLQIEVEELESIADRYTESGKTAIGKYNNTFISYYCFDTADTIYSWLIRMDILITKFEKIPKGIVDGTIDNNMLEAFLREAYMEIRSLVI